jgi:hypothetical protein
MRRDLDRLLKLKPTEANGRHLRDSMICISRNSI